VADDDRVRRGAAHERGIARGEAAGHDEARGRIAARDAAQQRERLAVGLGGDRARVDEAEVRVLERPGLVRAARPQGGLQRIALRLVDAAPERLDPDLDCGIIPLPVEDERG
jgi:hypothetical protein